MNAFDVFISYSNADQAAVREIADRLEKEGLRPWLDERQMKGGDLIVDSIQEGLAACQSCAVFIGPSGLGRWQAEEVRLSIERRATESHIRGKPPFRVIPVLLPGTSLEALDEIQFLKVASAIRFEKSIREDKAFSRLLQTVRGTPLRLAPDEAVVDTEPPYRGLEPFEEKHGGFFFGRRALTERLVNELNKSVSGEKRLLAVLGPSGSGKSSLARAGLMRAVRAGPTMGNTGWQAAALRPGANPLESLALALAGLGACARSPGDVQRLQQDLLSREDTLHLAARLVLQNTQESRLLLLIDQFEELFAWGRRTQASLADRLHLLEAADGFIRNLLYAISVPEGPVTLVLTLRTDFLGKCAAYPEFASVLSAQSVVIGPLSEDELREAIEMPALKAGCEVNSDLVQALLSDVRKAAGGLPLLQDVLLELWNRRTARYLTLDTYAAIGKLEGALEARADAVLKRLEQQIPGTRDLCRKIFLRLVQPGEGTADTRKRVSVQELLSLGDSDAVLGLIQVLAGKEARLLVTESDEGHPENACVEVAHETLISEWSELRKWVEADRPGFRLRHRLTEAASEWRGNRRDRSYLYTGSRLALAQDWIEDHQGELTRLEQRFLRASRALQTRQEEHERREQVRQLAQAKALAEEQQRRAEEQAKRADAERLRADAEKRQAEERVRRLKLDWVLGVLCVVVVICVFTIRTQKRIARSRMLARQAVSELGLDPQLSVADAAKAARMSPDEGEDVLRQALWESQLVRQIDGYPGAVAKAAFSPNGRLVATGDDTGGSYLYDMARSSNTALNPSHASAIHCLEFSPDGTLLLTASADHTVRTWETEQARFVAEFTNHTSSVRCATFSPDNRHVASCSSGDTVSWVWSATNTAEAIPFVSSNEITKITFDPKGELLAVGSIDGSVTLWKWRERKRLALVTRNFPVRDAAFSPDGERVIVAWASQTAEIFKVSSTMEREASLLHQDKLTRALFSPDGELVLTLTKDGVAWIWGWRSSVLHFNLRHSDGITDACFSNTGEFIVTASFDRTAQVWSGRDGRSLALLKGHGKQVNCAVFSPNSQSVITGSDDQTARVWALRLGRGFSGPARTRSAMLSADSRKLLLVDDHTVYVHEPGGQALMAKNIPGVGSRAAISRDGNWVIVAAGNKVQLWSPGDPTRATTLSSGEIYTDRLALSHNGLWVTLFDTNGVPTLWRRDGPVKPAPISGIAPVPGPIDVALFSPDSCCIFTVASGTNCIIWDSRHWNVLDKWSPPAKVLCAAFSPNSAKLAIGCVNGLAYLRNRRTAALENTFVGHSEAIGSIAFSPDSQFLITGSADKTARLWVAKTGYCFGILRGQVAPLLAVGFGSDSHSIVTVSEGGMIRRYLCPQCCAGDQLLQLADTASAAKTSILRTKQAQLPQ